MYEALVSSGILAMGTIVAAYVTVRKHKQQAQRAQDNLSGITLPARVADEYKRISIMLLGIGGSGKTTFISSLFDNKDADPNMKTESYDLYESSFSTRIVEGGVGDIEDGEKITMFIGDYKGQDIGTLIRTFILQQKESYHPMAYGYINSLILIVDVVAPPSSPNASAPRPREEADEPRIDIHNEQWNDTALDAVFGLLTSKSLQYVCLFINKYDLIKTTGAKAEQKLKQSFKPLIDRLTERAQGAGSQFEIIIGSAQTGAGVPPIKQKLSNVNVQDK